MKDECGSIKNESQAIRSLSKVRMAHLLHGIKHNPDKYPDTVAERIEWLNMEGGDTIDRL